jgi:hypothetical protein
MIRGLLVVLAFVFCGVAASPRAESEQGKQDTKVDARAHRVFEMRTYYAAPGKMAEMHARFRNHTCKLFEKHGMTLIGFWTPADAKDGENKMVYILAFSSKDAAAKSWAAFRDDPEWKRVRAESEKNGRLVEKVESVYLNPTDYSPMK